MGVTINRHRLDRLSIDYTEQSERLGRKCLNIAATYGYELHLPKSGNNKSLSNFVFGSEGLNLEPFKESKKTGAPSLDRATMDHYEATLPARGKAASFIHSLKAKRKKDTSLNYMEGYRRFWLPLKGIAYEWKEEWYVLYPSFNPTGTDTLRWASSNPNGQNVSKLKDENGLNLRYAFGPAEGREWWSLDAKNIELRIPAYEAKETEMIDLFERPNDPPYFGNYHMLVFSILHPERFRLDGMSCKELYADTWYQWTKNGNYAVQYGAMEESGTADRAYHVRGAQVLIQIRFPKIAELNREMIAKAERDGYVETLPDRTVDECRGYPILCSRNNWGQIKPTIPLNYHVSSTCMWVVTRGMVAVADYLKSVDGASLIMQIHDEIVLDFPYRKKMGNLPKLKKIKSILDRLGNDLVPRINIPFGIEYHPENWAEGETVA